MIRTAFAVAAAASALAAPAAAHATTAPVTPVQISGTCWIGDPEGNVTVPVVYVLGKRVTPDHPICN
jgi:hypothetical protein